MLSRECFCNPRSVIPFSVACVLVLFLTSSAIAQTIPGTSWPDRLALGTLRVGSTAEVSARIFFPGGDTTGLQVIAQPPPFARLVRTRLEAHVPKRGEPYITCDVIIALNTDRAAEYQGTIRVALGDEVIEVPVTASVLAQEPGLSRVLLVDTPIQRYSTDDASVFNPWLELVKRAKLDPHYLEIERGRPVLRELDLTKFDVVLIWGDGLFSATATDFDKLRGFVDSGGRCIVAANHFFQGSVARANEFIVPFGLRMKDEEPPGVPAVTVTVAQDWLAKHLLTQGVGNLKFFRPSPIAVEDEAHAELLVTAPLFPGHGFAAVAHSGRGEVVVLGISLWSYWIASEMESGADNAVMLGNLLAKP